MRIKKGENVLLEVITVAIKQAPPKVDFLPQPPKYSLAVVYGVPFTLASYHSRLRTRLEI